MHYNGVTKKTAQSLDHENKDRPRGARGVITFIHQKYSQNITNIEMPPELYGSLAHTQINQPGSNTIHIIGVYMPGDDQEQRNATYTYISDLIDSNKSHYFLLSGD